MILSKRFMVGIYDLLCDMIVLEKKKTKSWVYKIGRNIRKVCVLVYKVVDEYILYSFYTHIVVNIS